MHKPPRTAEGMPPKNGEGQITGPYAAWGAASPPLPGWANPNVPGASRRSRHPRNPPPYGLPSGFFRPHLDPPRRSARPPSPDVADAAALVPSQDSSVRSGPTTTIHRHEVMQYRSTRPGLELSQGEDPTMRRGTAAAELIPVSPMPKSTGVSSPGHPSANSRTAVPPRNISLAVSPPAPPRRMVEPSPAPTTATGDNGVAAAPNNPARLLNTTTDNIPDSTRPESCSETSHCPIDKAVPHQVKSTGQSSSMWLIAAVPHFGMSVIGSGACW